MIRGRVLAVLCVLGLSVSAASNAIASTRYDPRLRFRTISTPRFDIHFHQGGEAQARRLAVIAEEVAKQLDRTLGVPAGRVHVILVNQADLPNGWATPVPNNVIEITAAAPGGESLIGNTNDWLRLVFTHEYTHVIHLSRAEGWIGGLRRVFGRMPLLFPNVFTPLWQIEGLATFEESALGGDGRIDAGDFRMIVGNAAMSSMFLPLDRVNGGLVDWPGGHAPYAYGGLFHQYLADRFGRESLRQLTDTSAGRPPYFGATAFRSVFKRSVGDLWKDFEAHTRESAAPLGGSRSAARLTHHGFDVKGPRYASDGRIFYAAVNPHEFPALMAVTTNGAEPQVVTPRYLGSRIGFAGDELVFDQVELVQNVGLQSDLYAVRPDTGEVRRLTREARAADPDVSPDGRTIACTIQRDEGRALGTMSIPGSGQIATPTVLIADARAEWASPRWSPDGSWIAAERRRLGGPSEIVLVSPISGSVRTLVSSSATRNVSPAWTPDGRRVLFASADRSGFQIYSVDITTGAVARLNDTGPNAQSPDVSADGRSLVYVGYTAEGYDLFTMRLDSAVWTPEQPEAPASGGGAAMTASSAEAGAYSPWRTLAPRFWVPTLEDDAGEVVVGGATAGYDALGRHAYALEGGWSGSRGRPDWQLAYAYDRWWPTLFANFSDDTDPWRGGELRTREVNAGVLLPVRRVRQAQSVLAAVHSSTDAFTCNGCGAGADDRASRRALRAGWLIDAARGFGYSVSEEEGWSAGTTLELTREALGSDGNAGAATADVRGYVRVGPRHAVFAARAAGATTWGNEPVRRVFSASGNDAQGRGFDFGSDAIGMIRGIDEGDVFGNHAAVVNVDYRFPLSRIERGIGTLPVFARTIHGAVFADVGHAWSESFRGADFSRSFGAELSLDAVLGYTVPLTFSAGAAWRTTPDDRGAVFFARIGRAF
jgi:Omp85 superfamily domain/WD40-like Beta Propeller Repeat